MIRALLPRLLALVAVIGIGAYYVLIDVVQVNVGAAPIHVTVQLQRASGLYVNAGVTYNGVNVGKVSSIQIQPDRVDVVAAIRSGIDIPADARVQVRQMSALGEQYMDFVPTGPGPRLRNGSVVPESRVTLPVPTNKTLADVGSLVSSLNPGDLAAVESFLTNGFSGTDQSLRQIVLTGQALAQALVSAQPATTDLITDGQPVLQTLASTNAELNAYATNLDSFTGQLAQSDSDVAALLRNGTTAAASLNALLRTDAASIEGTLGSFATSTAVADQYLPQFQLMFQTLPAAAQALASVIYGGTIHGSVSLNGGNTVCPYLGAAQQPGPTQKVATATLTNSCPTTAPDLLQRGAAAAAAGAPGTGQ